MVLLLVCTQLLAASAIGGTTSQEASGPAQPVKRSRMKVIDFEDQVVEGVNKRPLDALALLGDGAGNRNRKHLYRKRIGYRAEIEQTLQDMRVQP